MINIEAVTEMSHNTAIIVAAGTGSRSGLSTPKQFAMLNGRPVLDWSLRTFSECGKFDEIVVVISDEYLQTAKEICQPYNNISIVLGGKERADSVRNALKHIKPNSPDIVLIHDAARPGVSLKIIDSLFEALIDYLAAAPALQMMDSIKKVGADGKLETLDRSPVRRIQTPQAFRFNTIWQAQNGKSSQFVDDLEAVESLGADIALIQGENSLVKITLPEDFEMAEKLLQNSLEIKNILPRIGNGYDVHAFEDGQSVTLCGLEIPHSASLKGHSDADVAWHALTDAIYGALAEGDIGTHFPPSDVKWKGAASKVFLKHAVELADSKGFMIANADITIICEAPKIKPHSMTMRDITSKILGIPLDRVSVKATTTEKLGFTGRKEGIAAQASVLLVSSE